MSEAVPDIEDISLNITSSELALRFQSKMCISDKSFSFNSVEVSACRTKLLRWYVANRRPLPWRGDAFEVVMAARARSGVKSEGEIRNDEGENTTVAQEENDLENSEEYNIDEERGELTASLISLATSIDKVYVTPPKSAYGTWVSEIMLQQTRVDTVVPYWYRWMERWPTLSALAASEPEEVNAVWAGLGYYRRAQQLLKGAKLIAATTTPDQEPKLPATAKELKEIPGIGPYTAGAISSIAYGQAEPLVDGNVLRVFSRLRALHFELGSKEMEAHAWALAAQLVDPQQPGDFNQALMELGATVCKPTNPTCESCPVRSMCQARLLTEHKKKIELTAYTNVDSNENTVKPECFDAKAIVGADEIPSDVTYFPIRAMKKKPREVIMSVAVFEMHDTYAVEHSSTQVQSKRYLFVRRPAGGLLQNQWEFPSAVLWEEAAPQRGKKVLDLPNNKTKTSKTKSVASTVATAGESSGARDEILTEVAAFERREDVPEQAEARLAVLRSHLQRTTGCLWLNMDENGPGNRTTDPTFIITSLSSISDEQQDVHNKIPTRHLEPIVHVFSHQKHFMHVAVIPVRICSTIDSTSSEAFICPKPRSGEAQVIDLADEREALGHAPSQRREVRWMTAAEISEAGITSGCKKILTAVEKQSKPTKLAKRKTSSENEKPAKAKRSSIDGKKPANMDATEAPLQPSIAKFFAKKI